jgi:hypothetical protein
MAESRTIRVGAPGLVERTDVQVMYLEVDDVPAAIARGWDDLERRLGTLRGRRFLGTFGDGSYRASVEVTEGDDPISLGLSAGRVRGGRYLRLRLRGEPDEIYARIPAAFATLEDAADRDPDRDPIESYRRLDEVDLLIPVRDTPTRR